MSAPRKDRLPSVVVRRSIVVCGAVTVYIRSRLPVLLSKRSCRRRLDVLVTLVSTTADPAGKFLSTALVKSLRNTAESVVPVTVCEHWTVTVPALGARDDGAEEGMNEGGLVGAAVGDIEGRDGREVGWLVGCGVGVAVGAKGKHAVAPTAE